MHTTTAISALVALLPFAAVALPSPAPQSGSTSSCPPPQWNIRNFHTFVAAEGVASPSYLYFEFTQPEHGSPVRCELTGNPPVTQPGTLGTICNNTVTSFTYDGTILNITGPDEYCFQPAHGSITIPGPIVTLDTTDDGAPIVAGVFQIPDGGSGELVVSGSFDA